MTSYCWDHKLPELTAGVAELTDGTVWVATSASGSVTVTLEPGLDGVAGALSVSGRCPEGFLVQSTWPTGTVSWAIH